MSSKPKKKSKDPAKTFPYIFVHATSQKGSKKSKYMPKWKWERTMPKNHGKFDPDEFIEDSILKKSHKQKVRHIPSGGNKRRTRRKKKRRKKGGQLNKKTKNAANNIIPNIDKLAGPNISFIYLLLYCFA